AALRNINRSFEKLETTEMVPIPDEPGIIVDYEHLIRLEEENIEYYLPGKSKMKYKVSDLLGSIGGKIEEDETMQIFRRIKVEQTQRKSTGKKRGQARDTKEKVK
ncbi:MAG: hypothetical protein GY950_21130, partial [bacterium]|nr:hypothetical protein [bacterium]